MTENEWFEDTQKARPPTKLLRHTLVCAAVVLALCLVLAAPAGAEETPITTAEGLAEVLGADVSGNVVTLTGDVTISSTILIHLESDEEIILTTAGDYTISRGAENITLFGIYGGKGGVLTIIGKDTANQITIDGKKDVYTQNTHSLIHVYGGGILNISENTVVTNNVVASGHSPGAIWVVGDGQLYITGGSITSNDALGSYNSGGAISTEGKVVMTSGLISENTASGSAGAIEINAMDGASFDFSGGEISDNTASHGGGVSVTGESVTYDTNGQVTAILHSYFNMTGGCICNNTAEHAGGVQSFGIFTMSGGVITNNTATHQYGIGGIEVSGGHFIMTGGSIHHNNGYDSVSITEGRFSQFVDDIKYERTAVGNFSISGNAVIPGSDRLFLHENATITVSSQLNIDAGVYNISPGKTTGVIVDATSAGISGDQLASHFALNTQSRFSLEADGCTLVLSADGANPTPDPSPSDMLYINTEQHGYHGEDITLSGTGSAGSTLYFYVKAVDDVNTITVPFRQLTDAGFPVNTTVNAEGNWSIIIPGSAFYNDAGVISPYYTFYVSTVSGAASSDVFTSCAMLSMSIPSPYLYVWGYGDDDGNVASGATLTVTGGAYGADSIIYYLFGNNKIVTDTVSVSANEDFSFSIPNLPDGLYSLVIQHPMYDDRFSIVPNWTDTNGIEIDVETPAGNYTETGILFSVPSTSGIAYGSRLISAINELESMDAAVYIQTLVGSLSIEMNPLSDSVTKGTLIEISGSTNAPYGSNITVMYGLETASEASFSYFITSGEETSDWNTTIDTTEFEPGIYVVAVQLTDYPGIFNYTNFTVLEPPQVPTSITLDISDKTINATQSAALIPIVYDQNGDVIADEEIIWTIEAVETVTQNNVSIVENTFNTLAAAWGTVNITATAKNNSSVSEMVSVFIEPLRADAVTITEKPSSSLEAGDTFQFQAEFKDQLGNSFIDLGYGWSSDNESVGTIDKASGLFTALNPGTVNVTIYSGSGSANMTVPVSVVAAAPAEITLEPISAYVNCSETVSFTAVVKDKHGNVISDAPITWSVDTENFGKIDSNGNFTAVSSLIEQDGTVTVTASPTGYPGITDTATVTVIGFHAAEILLTPTSATLEVGDTITFSAVVKDQFGNILGIPVTWTSDTSNVGTVSEGVVTAVQKGTTTITASAGSVSNYTEIIVIDAVPREISISPVSATINATESVQFTLTVKDKYGKTIENAPVQWETDRYVGSVSADGIFTSDNTASGTVNITAHALGAENVNATAMVTIIPLHAETLTLTAVPQGTLEVNETFQFTAEVRDQLGNLFDTTVSWESDNTSVGTIGAIGNFTAVSIGAVNITASVGDLRVTQPVSVVPAVPHEIIIDPATSILNASETVRLNVTIKDKRGDIIDSGFTWAKNTDEYGTLVDGVFTAGKLIEKNGEVIVTVTPTANESIHANATIKVNGFFATTVTITNKSNSEPVENAIELNPGQTHSFNATVKDQHDDDFPEGYANLTWKSSKTNVGTIVNGLFTAKEVGETTITAQSGNATKTVLIKVFEEVEPELDNVDIYHDSTEEMISGNTVVNITVDTSNEKTEVKVDTKKNETTIKDKETNVTLVISFSKMENTTSGTSQSIEGNITAIKAEYPKMNVTASENISAPVTFQMNLDLKNLTTNLPTVKPVINETKKDQIREKNDFKHHEVGAMVEVDSNINSNLSTAELVFYIPKDWVATDKLKVLHIKDNDVKSHDSFKVEPDKDGKNWKVTITVTGFSAYAVTKDTYVAPSTGDTNKPTYPTGSGKKPTTPVTPPTEEPTEEPSDEPESPDVPGIDTPTEPETPETPETPAPVAGMILGALAAAAVLRRK